MRNYIPENPVLNCGFYCSFRKFMKGGLCDKNACHNRCVFVVYSIFVNARVFLYWRTKNMEVKLYETIN